ncbi:hypothetical protein EsH8_I_001334 [Colletotrichum jinshuiense]
MAPPRRKLSSLLSALLLAIPALAKVQNNFDLYPQSAQPCLYTASDASGCDGDTVAVMNKCLCSDDGGKFVSTAATCIGNQAKDALRTVYQSMSTACTDSKTPIALTEDQFLSLGAQGATASLTVTLSTTSKAATPTTLVTTTAGGATVTVTPTSTPTPTGDPDDSPGLSTTAKIGIGVGGGVGVVALIGLAAFLWRLKKSRDFHDESHRPMLGGGIGAAGHNPQHGPFTEYSPPASSAAFAAYNAGGGSGGDYRSENKQQPGWRPVSELTESTSPGVQTWATNSPQPPYAQPYDQQQKQHHSWGHHPQAPYAAPPPPQPVQQEAVFELASLPVSSPPHASQPPPDAVEMPATELHPSPARYQYPPQR